MREVHATCNMKNLPNKSILMKLFIILMLLTQQSIAGSTKTQSQFYEPVVRMYLEHIPLNSGSVINSVFVSYDEKGLIIGRSNDPAYAYYLTREVPSKFEKKCIYKINNNEVKQYVPINSICPKVVFCAGELLQKTINYAVEGGFPLKVTSRAYLSGKYNKVTPFLTSYRTIKIPPATTTQIEFLNVVMLSIPFDRGPALQFDSAEGLFFEQKGGQILYRGNAAAVLFKPENPTTNADDAIQINTSKIKFSAITVQEQAEQYGGVPVRFDISRGSIWSNFFEFGETDGFNKGDYVIEVTGTRYSKDQHRFVSSFEANIISASLLVRANKSGIKIGNSEDDRSLIVGNIWNIGSIEPSNINAIGIISYGAKDNFKVGNIGSRHMAPGMAAPFNFYGDTSNRIEVGSIHDNKQKFYVQPHLIRAVGSYNIVGFLDNYWGIPHDVGEIAWDPHELRKNPKVFVAATFKEVEDELRRKSKIR